MNILITGAKGFVGRNLVETLKTIRDGKNRTRDLKIEEIYEFDIDTDPSLLSEYCQKADSGHQPIQAYFPQESSLVATSIVQRYRSSSYR